jgi:hypothetical protein
MTTEELEAFRETAPDHVGGELWSLLDWSFWGAGMADVFREPLADVMLAAIPVNVRVHAEAIMADFIKRRGIDKTGVTVYQEQRAEVELLRTELSTLRSATVALARAADTTSDGLGVCEALGALPEDVRREAFREARRG